MNDKRTDGYFTSIRARDAQGIAQCFAENGVLAFIDGSEIKGRDGVHEFYTKLLAKAAPQPELKNVVSDGKYVVVELRGKLNDKPIIAIDHFTFDEAGLIERLAIYSK